MSAISAELRAEERARAWGVAVEATLETPGSLVAFGRRGRRRVVLKVVRRPGDEWRGGAVLEAFGGRGVVRVLAHTGGAALLERLDPGTPLAQLALDGRDDEATEVLAGVMGRMAHPQAPPAATPTVEDWGRGFAGYLASGDGQLPRRLVERAAAAYAALAASQRGPRLLHGDLQHYNVLFDHARGWVAIDPKGVVGEREYEVGASLRNPGERPALFASAAAAERRVGAYAAALGLEAGRALAWGFAQAVLSVVWSVEDGVAVPPTHPALRLARALAPRLDPSLS